MNEAMGAIDLTLEAEALNKINEQKQHFYHDDDGAHIRNDATNSGVDLTSDEFMFIKDGNPVAWFANSGMYLAENNKRLLSLTRDALTLHEDESHQLFRIGLRKTLHNGETYYFTDRILPLSFEHENVYDIATSPIVSPEWTPITRIEESVMRPLAWLITYKEDWSEQEKYYKLKQTDYMVVPGSEAVTGQGVSTYVVHLSPSAISRFGITTHHKAHLILSYYSKTPQNALVIYNRTRIEYQESGVQFLASHDFPAVVMTETYTEGLSLNGKGYFNTAYADDLSYRRQHIQSSTQVVGHIVHYVFADFSKAVKTNKYKTHPWQVAIPIPEVNENHIPYVTTKPDETQNIYPVCESYNGGVYIYVEQKTSGGMLLPKIELY